MVFVGIYCVGESDNMTTDDDDIGFGRRRCRIIVAAHTVRHLAHSTDRLFDRRLQLDLRRGHTKVKLHAEFFFDS